MAFTQPCFIRKNTPELRNKLEELGYNRYPLWMADWDDNDSRYKYLVADVLYYTYQQEPSKPKSGEHINCGTNEELFLALAALRDDTDKNQWFTDGKLWEKSNDELPSHYMQLEGHKATVEEIIEHFKDR